MNCLPFTTQNFHLNSVSVSFIPLW
jgi:hypothetical protein